jgi:hypothetical protein
MSATFLAFWNPCFLEPWLSGIDAVTLRRAGATSHDHNEAFHLPSSNGHF